MKQDVKIGSVGEAQVSESVAGEEVKANIGPVQLDAKVSNAVIVAELASRLKAGWLHDGVMLIAKELGVEIPAPAPAPAEAAAPAAPQA